jgi:3',5'-cyclic AMP phosphodiesterase CpdA
MRLAHCSDLHLLSHEGARLLQYANKRWIGAMNLLSSRSRHYHTDAFEDMVADLNALGVEQVLCTGDVTNLALAREFAYARARFDQLAVGPEHVTVIPGNHDAYVAEGVAHFLTSFADYCRSDAGWAWAGKHSAELAAADAVPGGADATDPELHWPIVRVRGDVAIVGLSTSKQTPWFTAYGTVGKVQLARLARALSDPRLAGKVRIVAIHHPPAGRRAFSKVRGLRDHLAFAAVLAEHGADLVVHGHEHHDLREVLLGPDQRQIPVLGVPSGTYEAAKPHLTGRYRIIEIENGRIAGHHLRVWHRAGRRFDRDAQEPAMSAKTG